MLAEGGFRDDEGLVLGGARLDFLLPLVPLPAHASVRAEHESGGEHGLEIRKGNQTVLWDRGYRCTGLC